MPSRLFIINGWSTTMHLVKLSTSVPKTPWKRPPTMIHFAQQESNLIFAAEVKI